MKKFGQYITEGAPEGDNPNKVKPGDPDYNRVMALRAKYGIDPTPDGGVDPEAIDQRAVRKGIVKALGSKKFKKDMQDHTIANERLQQIDEAIPLALGAMAAARVAGGAIARGAFRILGRGGARGILGRAGGMAAKAPGAAFRMAKRNPFTTGTIVGSMLSGKGKNQQQQQQNTGGGY
tara:strand:+ start:1532 stop:2065 length:534 start_codon:yes stop_codon:yes gene_type:complete